MEENVVIAAGNCGLYAGPRGIRVEDTIVVGKEGPVILTHYPRHLGKQGVSPPDEQKEMDEKRFNEVLQFAIEKEIGTYSLYSMCDEIAKYSGGKELFEELAKEEEGHRKLLEELQEERVAQTGLEPIPDLRISDYLVDVECKPDSS